MYHQTIEANLIAEVNLNGQKQKKKRQKKEKKQTDFKKKGKQNLGTISAILSNVLSALNRLVSHCLFVLFYKEFS